MSITHCEATHTSLSLESEAESFATKFWYFSVCALSLFVIFAISYTPSPSQPKQSWAENALIQRQAHRSLGGWSAHQIWKEIDNLDRQYLETLSKPSLRHR
jgi:hypothetical protein